MLKKILTKNSISLFAHEQLFSKKIRNKKNRPTSVYRLKFLRTKTENSSIKTSNKIIFVVKDFWIDEVFDFVPEFQVSYWEIAKEVLLVLTFFQFFNWKNFLVTSLEASSRSDCKF